MTELGAIALNIVLPIFLAAMVGFVAARVGWVTDARSLSRATLYVFSPALILNSLYKSNLADADFFSLMLFAFLVAGVVGPVAWALARGWRLDALTQNALVLSVLFTNSGNYGLALNQFAFGDAGLARAAIYFVANTILGQTAGVYIASSGHASPRASLLKVFQMPLIYAALGGFLLNRLHFALPLVLERSIDLVSAAAVPVMLLILGVELAGTTLGNDRTPVLLGSGLKLLISPLIALALAWLLPFSPLTRNVAVLQASMPTAVTASLLAVEFACKPKQVAGIIMLTTLGSLITLPILISFLT